jgi:isoquinoline 1-oxidoreductase alpha subunit
MKLRVNGQEHDVPVRWRSESLLTVLREYLGLVGAKHGCGVGVCGTCTVHLDGGAVRSCVVPASEAVNQEIGTIEGLANDDGSLHPVQKAWLEERVVQCGFCQAGQIMQAAVLLAENAKPDDRDIAEAMSGSFCRCGTQSRIRKAIHRAAAEMRLQDG